MATREQHEILKRMLQMRRVNFMEEQTGMLVAPFSGDLGQYMVVVRVQGDMVTIVVRHPARVEESLRADVAEFIARTNFGMGVTNGFVLDPSDGEFGLESSSPAPKDDSLLQVAGFLFESSMTVWKRFYPSFLAVLSGAMSPMDAVADCRD
eukprot:TRINITY_DN3847_c0_g1_i2.p1 TRINITY_DN3847_c0_g1~~TRINITY_DN3847_c0_g1_i2.p1  ORF type:complete len:151 (+),score=27.02 TRINITY_DN3847_c0_g1_i2:49-501(+)